MNSASPAKILVVEDESIVALDIAEGLGSFGYNVVGTVATGEEAVSAARELKPDLILMDIVLRGKMDGIAASSAIHDSLKIPVVFLTAHADESTLQRAKLTQPFGYILKPYDVAELRTTIEVTLHRAGIEHSARDGHAAVEEPHADETAGLEGVPTLTPDARASEMAEFLSKLRLFAELPPQELERLASVCSVRQLEGGDFILHEGSNEQGGFVVLTGRIAVVKSSLNGKELIVELLPPGDIYGLLTTLNQLSLSTAARAQVPSQILWVPKASFHALLAKYPQIYRNVSKEMARRLTRSHDLASCLAHASVEVRIISSLLALVPDFGRGNDEMQSRIYLTRRELAELTGTTPETAIRITKNLERDKLLDLTRPGIIKILDLNRLRETAAREH